MENDKQPPIFDYRSLRLIVGVIAFSLPVVVTLVSNQSLDSISASYYTNAGDVFVGMLFVVGAFLLAYNGHTRLQLVTSKIAALAAIGVALFPTTCADCEPTVTSALHYTSAALLFSILAYFCFGPFREKIKAENNIKKKRRSRAYFLCGSTMIGAMLIILLSQKGPFKPVLASWTNVVYCMEALALSAFGVAWMIAGKHRLFRFLVDEKDALKHLF